MGEPTTTVKVSGADLRAFFANAKAANNLEAWCDCAMQWMIGAEQELAASQREREQLELQRQRAVEIALDERAAKERLRARVEAAEKLIVRWRFVAQDMHEKGYDGSAAARVVCSDELERVLAPVMPGDLPKAAG